MRDAECPYCEAEVEINHDDGYGYEEDGNYEQQCHSCDKYFHYTTSISFYYDVSKADCLNGEEHKFAPVQHYPPIWPDWKRCVDCGYEEQGEYVPEEKK